jgi:hypothetical protein
VTLSVAFRLFLCPRARRSLAKQRERSENERENCPIHLLGPLSILIAGVNHNAKYLSVVCAASAIKALKIAAEKRPNLKTPEQFK